MDMAWSGAQRTREADVRVADLSECNMHTIIVILPSPPVAVNKVLPVGAPTE